MMTTTFLEREQKTTVQVTKQYDKRYFPRWEVNKRVEYSEEGGVLAVSYTKDLSLDGVSIFISGNPPSRRRVQLRIHLADKKIFEAKGRIAWSKIEPTHKLFGVFFENLSKEAQELILCHAFELNEDQQLIYG